MFLMLMAAVLHFWLMKSLKDRVESRFAPRYFIQCPIWILSPAILMLGIECLVSICGLPKMITSVFDGFNLSRLADIQLLKGSKSILNDVYLKEVVFFYLMCNPGLL